MPARRLLASSLALAAATATRAELLPPASARELPRGFAVLDERDHPQDLREMTSGAPALILPMFTRCGGTCPLTALALKEALARARAPFRVIALSFDADDTAKDLEDFRERFALPAEWRTVRGSDPAATRAFLDRLEFRFMKAGEGFDHPARTFVVSPRGTWAATLLGTRFSGAELEVAWRRASTAGDPAPLPRLRAWLIRPEAWILLACAGLSLSICAVLLLARRGGLPARRGN
ncbi:MAG TPA: SCO family protein [Myxococcales bacterium]|nr:SCO family protein [Myxococcales bacterium]